MSVSGRMIWRTPIIDGNQRYSWTKNRRSLLVSRALPRHVRPSTISCWRRTAFSASSRAVDLNGETKRAKANHRSPITRSAYAIRPPPQWNEVFGTHGAVENKCASAALRQLSIAIEADREVGNFVLPRFLARCDRLRSSDKERTMERICRYRVGGHETPVGVDRLHDLVAERDPIDAINKPGLIHARKRRLAQSKYDFRLDTGLHEVA